jgi:hypothetical protein
MNQIEAFKFGLSGLKQCLNNISHIISFKTPTLEIRPEPAPEWSTLWFSTLRLDLAEKTCQGQSKKVKDFVVS